jgi:hypothetical protein
MLMTSLSQFLKWFFGMLSGCVMSLGAETLQDKVEINAAVDDVERPVVLSVEVPVNGSYRAGVVLPFTVHLSESVLIDASAGTPVLALKVGGDTLPASYASGTGTNALVFNYTVQAGNNDTDGIELPASLSPNGGTIRDVAGNDLVVALNGVASTAGVIVDSIAPVATGMMRLDPNPTNAASVRYGLAFSEPVTGLTYGDFAAATNGVGMSGGIVWVSKITQTSPTTYDLVVSGLRGTGKMHIILLSYATVYDVAGNRITSFSQFPAYDVDRVAPVVKSVAVPASATYRKGQNLDLIVNFSERITPNTFGGTPRIPITLDTGGTVFAYLRPGSDPIALTFRMTISAGQMDSNGITVGSTIDLNGGALRDAVGNDVDPTLNSVADTTGVRVDAVPPVVVGSGIPDQSLSVDGSFKLINLLSYFSDVGSSSMTYTVTANSAANKVSATISGSNLTLSPLANGVTDITVQANDGHGGTVSDTFEVTVGTTTPTPLQISTTGALNSQSGLFELTVEVTNTTPRPINGFRLNVDYSDYKSGYPSLRLYNASSPTGSSKVYVDYPFPVGVDAVIPMNLSFYTSTRTFPSPFTPELSLEVLTTSQVTDTNGEGVQPHIVALANKNILLEFPSVIGRWYRIRFSIDAIHWQDCPVPIQAGTTRMQWIDSGPPFTDVAPAHAMSRFYLVNEITAP